MRSVFIAHKSIDFINNFRNTVDWGRYDYKVIGFSDSGTKTMEEILRKKPDLVFICNDLPGIEGGEIIEKIHLHGLLTEFVLVEDEENFRLAQKAMRFGVREFLINPVTTEELTRVLIDCLDRYQAHRSKDMETYLFSTRRLLRNSFMRNFVSGEDRQHLSIEDLNKYYHITFKEGFFRCVVVQIRNLPKEEESTFLPAVVEELRFRFDPICNEMIPFIQGASRLSLVFNYNPVNGMPERIGEVCDVVKEYLTDRDCSVSSYSVGVGNEITDVNSLLYALHSAERAAYCSILQGVNRVYMMDQLSFDGIKKEDVLTAEFMNNLKLSVETMDLNRYENALRKAFEKITVHTDPEIIVEVCRAAIIEVAKADGDAEATQREEIRRVLYSVMNASSLSVITATLVKKAKARLDAIKKEREFSRPVREATRYIKNNFSKNITLANVADYVHLNASYLSMLFKKETGQNYMGFLTECRIDEAKKLLKESGMSVAEICYAVGYTDKKHFSRLFIKQVGVRPTSYRSLH